MCFLVNFHFLGVNKYSASPSQKSPISNTFRAGLGYSAFKGPHLPRLHHSLPLFLLRHGGRRCRWGATPNNLETGTRHSFPSCLDNSCCANNPDLCFHLPTLCEANQLVPVSKFLETGAVRRAGPRLLDLLALRAHVPPRQPLSYLSQPALHSGLDATLR